MKNIAKQTIIIGSDHGGFQTKEYLKKKLQKKYTIQDAGCFSDKPVDYPDIAEKVAKLVLMKKTKGVLICGSGTGMMIAANKIKGIRAAYAWDKYAATMARVDNDANIITLRGRQFSKAKTPTLVDLFMKTPFSGAERHKKRIQKIANLER